MVRYLDEASLATALSQLANNLRAASGTTGKLTIMDMANLVTKLGVGGKVTELKNQDLNTVKDAGMYFMDSNAGMRNLPTDPDTNSAILSDTPFTLNVISNDAKSKVTQELIDVKQGYLFVRSFYNSSWVAWSVMTPYS